MARAKKAAKATSPQAKLAAVIKTARDAMRKDAGLNGDLDRIPQLAWLLFLKAFDGLEENREITDAKYRPAIEEPYRWRDWAADPNGMTGDTLTDFVNAELLPYLRNLTGTGAHDPRDVLAAVFKETNNRMLSGYLLRDVVNKVNEINFASSDDIHTMAHLYESMLKDMRDAAGDSGEFYTPRPVIRFMVQQVAPQLGEVILDPACGTGGFLVEALTEIEPKVGTTQQHRKLHDSLRGTEKKPLPYLLGMMNLVLHGVGQPNVTRGNALNRPITQISRAERVDVVLTNPPFGGEEERSIQANFPADKQTAETAWLFLQLVIRQLKDGGRCAIVLPNAVLFEGGVGARIKQQLLAECNLHTIVRLPEGVFEPYTPIPSNLVFFEKTGRTKEVWFYEVPPPEGRKKYTKTNPMRFEEFAECQAWWGKRAEGDRSWRVPIADLEARDYNLDVSNPHGPAELAHLPPDRLRGELDEVDTEMAEFFGELRAQLGPVVGSIDNLLDAFRFADAVSIRAALPDLIDSILHGRSQERSTVGEIADFVSDTVHPGDDPAPADRFIGLQHIESHTGLCIGSDVLDELKGRKFRFQPGDVVYGYLRPYLNKVWVADCHGLCSVDQYVLRPRPGLPSQLIGYALRARGVLDHAVEQTHNLQLPRLRSALLRDTTVAISATTPDDSAVEQLEAVQGLVLAIAQARVRQIALAEALLPSVLSETFGRIR